MLNVIYEDNHILVCEKPVNMPVQADSTGDVDLLTEAKAYVKQKYAKPGEVYLGLVHRLDRPVGGVMVFARTSKAAARLTDAMKAGRIRKRYAAIVTNTPKFYGNIVNYIVKDEVTHSSRIVDKSVAGAQRASLEYAVVAEKSGRALVDVLLHTGRHHQIRVQLAAAGSPIYGDQRYNKAARPGEQIALYAYSLSFEHPTLREEMCFTCVPHGTSWSGFSDELLALTNGVRCAYIDEAVIAVNKQAGISCALADGGDDTLEGRLRCAFGEVYAVHRLDAPTSGLVLFARSVAARDELNKIISEHSLKKYYVADVFGRPPKQVDTLVLYAEKDADRARVRVADAAFDGALEMKTGYRVIETRPATLRESAKDVPAPLISRLEVELFTGRTHQIRASLAHIGCPVVGDDKYGDRAKNRAVGGGLRLAAVRLEFPNGLKALKPLCSRTLTVGVPFE